MTILFFFEGFLGTAVRGGLRVGPTFRWTGDAWNGGIRKTRTLCRDGRAMFLGFHEQNPVTGPPGGRVSSVHFVVVNRKASWFPGPGALRRS